MAQSWPWDSQVATKNDEFIGKVHSVFEWKHRFHGKFVSRSKVVCCLLLGSFRFLIVVGGPVVILIVCMIFLSSLLYVAMMSMSTVFFSRS